MFEGQYLTFAEYGVLGGTLTESAFNLLEFEARKKIDSMSYNRLVDLTTQEKETKLCIYKLTGLMNENKSSIKSESVDGYSKTLEDKKEIEKLYSSTIEDMLGEMKMDEDDDANETPYLYNGVDYPGEEDYDLW